MGCRSMDCVPVESSALAAAAYTPREQVLYREFRSGAIYRYFDFPPALYRDFLAADSKGRFFSRHIRDCFLCHQVGPARRNSG